MNRLREAAESPDTSVITAYSLCNDKCIQRWAVVTGYWELYSPSHVLNSSILVLMCLCACII